jgi:Ca2+-binding EF-hand superfamily protein
MINPKDFTEEEYATTIAQLQSFADDNGALHKAITDYFAEFDEDKNGYLDRKELRHFLTVFFKKFHVRLPLTDEFVDGVFREIDDNHDNKLQAEELEKYSSHFVTQILAQCKK